MVVGRKGEEIAQQYLRALDYPIHDTNVRLGRDEIDIVAYDPIDKIMVFAEVKTRSRKSNDYRPEMNLTHAKKEKMRRAARKWIAQHDFDEGYRIDLICVADGKIVDHFREIGWNE